MRSGGNAHNMSVMPWIHYQTLPTTTMEHADTQVQTVQVKGTSKVSRYSHLQRAQPHLHVL
jgi:hypothetical protein